jgi:hypothetical protein
MRKQELIFALLKTKAKQGEIIYGDGVLEVLPDGFGFLRSPETSYLANTDDIYISPSQIRRFNLHTGDKIEGEIRTPEGRRALFRADQARQDQRRAARGAPRTRSCSRTSPPCIRNKPLQASSATSSRRGKHHQPHHRHRRTYRQGPARPARRAAQVGQDGDAPAHRPCDRRQPSGRAVLIVLLIDERPRRGHRDDAGR